MMSRYSPTDSHVKGHGQGYCYIFWKSYISVLQTSLVTVLDDFLRKLDMVYINDYFQALIFFQTEQ